MTYEVGGIEFERLVPSKHRRRWPYYVVVLLVAALAIWFFNRTVPISGYGDFSEVAYEDIDWTEVTMLIVECMNDNGWDVQVSQGDGISYGKVRPIERGRASETEKACRAGLNLPSP